MRQRATAKLNACRLGNEDAISLKSRFLILSFLGLASACITVNVNFPETAVQQAANDFVRDLYHEPPKVAENSRNAAAEQTELVKEEVKKTSKKKKAAKPPVVVPPAKNPEGASFFNWVLPSAWADSASAPASAPAPKINMNTPKSHTIRERMKSRLPQLAAWKNKGVVCETEDGMLKVKDPRLAGAEAPSIAKLVSAENDDRDALYEEIQTANRINDRKQTKIRKFFAAAFRGKTPAQALCN